MGVKGVHHVPTGSTRMSHVGDVFNLYFHFHNATGIFTIKIPSADAPEIGTPLSASRLPHC